MTDQVHLRPAARLIVERAAERRGMTVEQYIEAERQRRESEAVSIP
ncbi:hypothetical protein ACFSBZ_06760 [Amnibacterium flavum]|nr:hypothetical protein [Amnibacterium flavum]